MSYFITDRKTTKFSEMIRAVYSRWNCILVHKLQETRDENTKQLVIEIVNEELDCFFFSCSDLERSLWIRAKKQKKSIITSLPKMLGNMEQNLKGKSNAYQMLDSQGNENNERWKNDTQLYLDSLQNFTNESTTIKRPYYTRSTFIKSVVIFDIISFHFTYWTLA